MGAVYKARQTKLDRLVALKIIRPESADDPAFAERFNREARTLARLHHPNIVAVHDFGEVLLSSSGEANETPRPLYYFLMEYVDGASLRQLMQQGEIQPDQSLLIVAQICDALQFAHDEHVIHRDIKPENILVDSKGCVRIADFGLAKLAARSWEEFTLTETHQVMGTPRYMAPEQMEGSHLVDHRADIYSLGVVFYEMLTGQVPVGHFETPSKKAQVDVRLDRIVLQTLAREPHHRYQQVGDLKADIIAVAGSSIMQTFNQLAPAVARVAGEGDETYMSEFDYEVLRLRARGPAGALMLVGSLGAGFWIVTGTILLSAIRADFAARVGWALGTSAAVVAGGFVIFGGLKLRNLQAYELCVAAGILVILPWSPAAVLGIPIGIWCLRMMNRADIQAAFVKESLRQRGFEDVSVPYSSPHLARQNDVEPPPTAAAEDEYPHYLAGPSTLFEWGVKRVGRWFNRG